MVHSSHRYDTLRPKLLPIYFICNFWSIYCTNLCECIRGITWLSISDFSFHSHHITHSTYQQRYKFWCWDGVVECWIFARSNNMLSVFIVWMWTCELTEYTITVWHIVNSADNFEHVHLALNYTNLQHNNLMKWKYSMSHRTRTSDF